MFEFELESGRYRIVGESKFKLVDGSVEVINKNLGDEEIFIPRGKSLPLNVLKRSKLRVELLEGGVIEKLKGDTIPKSWYDFLEEVKGKRKSRILILGGTDTGKTFLTTFLVNNFLKRVKSVSVIDLDPGQSEIGPPTTVGLVKLKAPIIFLKDVKPNVLYFLGNTSPAYNIGRMSNLIKFLVEDISYEKNFVIVNTPGWIHGKLAKYLISIEIELINPNYILILENGELSGIEHPHGRVIYLERSSSVILRDFDARRHFREFSYKSYFKDLKEFIVSADLVKSDEIEKIQSNRGEGVIIGLETEDSKLVGLGILKEFDEKTKMLKFLTPVECIDGVKSISIGDIKLSITGEEIGNLRRS